jgi:hypothetical protein
MSMKIDVQAICRLHRQTVAQWHSQETSSSCEGVADVVGFQNPYEGFLGVVCRQHEQNFRLWHQEDMARSPSATNAELAAVKRAIDKLNQQRNDLIERLDDWLIERLRAEAVAPWQGARLNTETPGSVIDRLSILALRLYHMEEQIRRKDASEAHVAKTRARLEILRQQHGDLSGSLRELLEDIFAGRKQLVVYRQFKMYNDPTMNPYLYGAKRPAA